MDNFKEVAGRINRLPSFPAGQARPIYVRRSRRLPPPDQKSMKENKIATSEQSSVYTTTSATTWEKTRMNVVKHDRNSERYFERLSAQSSAQNSVRLAVTEIVVKGCSWIADHWQIWYNDMLQWQLSVKFQQNQQGFADWIEIPCSGRRPYVGHPCFR